MSKAQELSDLLTEGPQEISPEEITHDMACKLYKELSKDKRLEKIDSHIHMLIWLKLVRNLPFLTILSKKLLII